MLTLMAAPSDINFRPKRPGFRPAKSLKCRVIELTENKPPDPEHGAMGYAFVRSRSCGAEILCDGFTRPAVSDDLEKDLLTLIEAMHSGLFDRADVHEDILAAIIWLDESEALLVVEPFHGSFHHIALSFR